MGNSLRGEADLKVPGSTGAGERTYRLVYDWNAAVEFEDQAGRSLWDALGKLTAKSVRAMLWAGLRERHSEVTPKEAGHLIDEVGRDEAVRVMRVALRHFFPELGAVERKEPGAAGGPPPGGPSPAAPAPPPSTSGT